MTDACETCRFWQAITVADCADPEAPPRPETPAWRGECRRYAPSRSGSAQFPLTMRGTWCGEYQPAGRLVIPGEDSAPGEYVKRSSPQTPPPSPPSSPARPFP